MFRLAFTLIRLAVMFPEYPGTAVMIWSVWTVFHLRKKDLI